MSWEIRDIQKDTFNAINVIPSCANKFQLETLARYVEKNFLYLHAGTDLDCDVYYSLHTIDVLKKGIIVESDIDRALERTSTVLVRLGWFDPAEQQVYRHLTQNNVDTFEARQLSLESAQQSLILLKNVNKALPLNLDQLMNKKIALIEPTANAIILMQGNYYEKAPFLIDSFTAFKSRKSITVNLANGCAISGENKTCFAEAIELARSADIVFFFGEIDFTIAREGLDRTSITLPDIQLSLLQELEKVSRSPLHVVIMSGSGLDLSCVRDSPQCASLLWMSHAGQSGGLALSNAVFDQYNQGGRLPITIYPASYVDRVSMFDMQMRPSKTNPGRT